MRIESFRNCDRTLLVLKYCKVCRRPKQLRSKNCLKYVDDPVHSKCKTISVGCN